MIRFSDLNGDFFYFDIDSHSAIGLHTHKKYQLGDIIKIKVKKVNIEKRHMDLIVHEK